MNIREKYSALRKAGKLHGTVKRAVALREERDQRAVTKKRQRLVRIPLGSKHQRECQEQARQQKPAVRNWAKTYAVAKREQKCVAVVARDCGRYSSRCTYLRYEYDVTLRSCGTCTEARLLWFIGTSSGRMLAPRGWRFGRDELGLYVERKANRNALRRYHFSSDDVLSGSVIVAARAHEVLQRKAAAEQRAEQRVSGEVCVLPGDSLRAGNCQAGTMAFQSLHKLQGWCRASVLQRIAERLGGVRAKQILRAVAAATARTANDLQRGYCLLSAR